jgi:hypothetical protein
LIFVSMSVDRISTSLQIEGQRSVVAPIASVVLFAAAFFALVVYIFAWDEAGIALGMIAIAVAPSAIAPFVVGRRAPAMDRASMRPSWTRLSPLLFAPWIIAVVCFSTTALLRGVAVQVDWDPSGPASFLANLPAALYLFLAPACWITWACMWLRRGGASELRGHALLWISSMMTAFAATMSGYLTVAILGLD